MMPIRAPGPKSVLKDWNFIVLIICIIGLGVVLYLIWHFKGLAGNPELQKSISKSITQKPAEEVIAKPVIWEKDISKVEDYTDLYLGQMDSEGIDDIYWYFLGYAKRVPQDYLNSNSKEYYFDGLTQNPQKYRGAMVKMKGWVGYYTPIRCPKDNPAGLDFIYRVYVKDSWGGDSRECYVYDLVEKPPPLKTEEKEGAEHASAVEVEGVFYKTVQYEFREGGRPRNDERFADLKEWMEQTIYNAKRGVPYKDTQAKSISQKEHEIILNKLEQIFNGDKAKDKNGIAEDVKDVFYSQMRQRQLPLIIGRGLKLIDEKNARRELGEFGSSLLALAIFALIVCTFITVRHILATRPKPPTEKIGSIRTIKKF